MLEINFEIVDSYGSIRRWKEEMKFLPHPGMIFIKHLVERIEVTDPCEVRFEYGHRWNKFFVENLYYDSGRLVVHGNGF